jgi:acyl-CoA hydrolase
MAMDRFTQSAEIRRLVSTPDVFLASVQAVTEDGRILVASGSGSQIGPIASGAGRVILVVGAQKVVRDLDEAFRRLEDYVRPLEDVRAMAAYGRSAAVNQTLVLHGGGGGRIAVVLITDSIGI